MQLRKSDRSFLAAVVIRDPPPDCKRGIDWKFFPSNQGYESGRAATDISIRREILLLLLLTADLFGLFIDFSTTGNNKSRPSRPMGAPS